MKKSSFVIIFIICFYASACTRDKDTWIAFYNKDTTLVGFKDEKGEIKIAPKFTTYSVARKFDDIIAVSEFKKTKSINYYLTKNGRVVGRDSLYYFDNTADCECEGFIRFKDHKSLKMGMFNANGDIAIPAIYNYLSPVRNGFIMALKDAKRVYPRDGDEEHFNPWEGGNEVLIDVNNNVLIANFPYDGDIDFYSVVISEKSDPDAIRKNFKANDGKYYSFISFTKEFNTWFKNKILKDITLNNLIAHAYDSLQIQNDPYRGSESKEKFFKGSFSILQSKLSKLNASGAKYEVFTEGLNPYTYTGKEFEKYFDNCGMSKDWLYPIMEVVIDHGSGAETRQDHFDFLRTSAGYKLIGVYFL